jgi:hypothetical protein
MIERFRIAFDYLFRSRLEQYEAIVRKALAERYRVLPVRDALKAIQAGEEKLLILRHDVDHFSPGLAGMIEVERRCGVKGTYYFRWATARQEDIALAAGEGHEVSFHYETLGTLAEGEGLTSADQIDEAVWHRCGDVLCDELARFRSQTGLPCLTIASHGAKRNRLLGLANAEILQRVPGLHRRLGIELEVYDPDFLATLDSHLSDTQWEINDGYRYGLNPLDVIGRQSRIQLLVHPHHWAFSPRVRAQRVVKALLKGRGTDPTPFGYAELLRSSGA